jgi:hypothetical protein
VYDDFDADRRPMGVTDDAVYQSVENPTTSLSGTTLETEEAARAFMSSEQLKNAMQRAGVQGQPEVWVVRA